MKCLETGRFPSSWKKANVFNICSLYVHHMFTICSPYVHYMFTISSLYVHYIFAISSLYVHYMFTIYSLYIHYVFTIYAPYRIHKKENKQLKKSYRPISLLPICRKIFEKLIFDKIYEYLGENKLLTPNKSGFRPGDSTVNQLLSITHKIYSAFEEFPSRETRAVFLDISKAFDKVWHDD